MAGMLSDSTIGSISTLPASVSRMLNSGAADGGEGLLSRTELIGGGQTVQLCGSAAGGGSYLSVMSSTLFMAAANATRLGVATEKMRERVGFLAVPEAAKGGIRTSVLHGDASCRYA